MKWTGLRLHDRAFHFVWNWLKLITEGIPSKEQSFSSALFSGKQQPSEETIKEFRYYGLRFCLLQFVGGVGFVH
jgi:hypothetical protein